jgi:hypothetical protein
MRTLRHVMLVLGVAGWSRGGSARGRVRGWRLRSLSGSALAVKPGVLAMRFCGRGSVASRGPASVGSLMCVATVGLWAASSSALAVSPVVVTFSPSSDEQDFTVPGGVTSVQILVRGGSGGAGWQGGSTAGAGGGGLQVTGTRGVSRGERLGAFVGFAGSPPRRRPTANSAGVWTTSPGQFHRVAAATARSSPAPQAGKAISASEPDRVSRRLF